jgi:hypothetical protein
VWRADDVAYAAVIDRSPITSKRAVAGAEGIARFVKRLCVPAVVAFYLANVATSFGATFYQQPPSANPSGPANYDFMVHSDGGGGENGAVAYKLPDGSWQRCQPSNTQFTMSNLPDGTYTVLIADDININYWAALGQLYSGHTAGCATTDPPATAVTGYTFAVGGQAAPTAPATPVPAAPITQNPAAPPKPPEAPTTSPVSAACSTARLTVASSRRQLAHARTAYRHHHTKLRKKRMLQAKKRLTSRIATARAVCPVTASIPSG